MSRFTNNVYVDFPGLMNNGREFNNQDPNSHLNDQILKKGSIVSNADYIITGNYNDFTIDKFRNTKIISAKDFCLLF